MFKLVSKKAQKPEIKLPRSTGPSKNKKQTKKKPSTFQKIIYFCFLDYTKVFDGVDHNKLKKIPKEIGIPDHLTCFLQNLYAGQETTT